MMKRHGLSSPPPLICQSSVFFIKARDSQPVARGLDVKSGYPEDLLGNSTPLLATGPPSADATLPGPYHTKRFLQSSVPSTRGMNIWSVQGLKLLDTDTDGDAQESRSLRSF